MFAALCIMPDFYRERMISYIAIAPIMRLDNMISPVTQNARSSVAAWGALKMAGPEIMTDATSNNILLDIATQNYISLEVTGSLLSIISDGRDELVDDDAWGNYAMFYPSGASFQSVDHLKQMIETKKFARYDYEDEEKNIQKYGQATPPLFDHSKITGFNIALVCGKSDLFAAPDDYNWLHETLKANGNNVDFSEFEQGHIGLLMPADGEFNGSVQKVVDLVKAASPVEQFSVRLSNETTKAVTN